MCIRDRPTVDCSGKGRTRRTDPDLTHPDYSLQLGVVEQNLRSTDAAQESILDRADYTAPTR